MRYVLEGEWTGYTSAQRRVVHREIIKSVWLKIKLEKLNEIVYTDGTSLLLTIRPANHRERVNEIHGYDSLIRDALHRGGSRVLVADLAKREDSDVRCECWDNHKIADVTEHSCGCDCHHRGQS